ncbi:MAG: hypothetical protein AAFW84_29225 [Cyanobacteria bacterium J06635_15]
MTQFGCDHLNAAAITTHEPAVVALLKGCLADDVDTLTRLRSQLSNQGVIRSTERVFV